MATLVSRQIQRVYKTSRANTTNSNFVYMFPVLNQTIIAIFRDFNTDIERKIEKIYIEPQKLFEIDCTSSWFSIRSILRVKT